jgi:hypothetical protein
MAKHTEETTVPDAVPAETVSAQMIFDENANQKDARGEMFYLDKDGNRSDAALHEAILAAGQESPEYIEDSKQVARDIGLTEEQIDLLYGLKELRKKGQHRRGGAALKVETIRGWAGC